MERKKASVHQYLILLMCVPFVVSSYHARTITTNTHKSLKLSMKPMHREHPRRMDIERYVSSRNDIRAAAMPDKIFSVLLVNISIGNPPVPQLLVMDTGSELVWTQCSSCTKCFNQDSPPFDPSKSLTFDDIVCTSPLCPNFRRNKCHLSKNCPYNITYLDGSNSVGTLGREELRFRTSDEGVTIVSDVIFGCGLENTMASRGGESGILGLNVNELSLASQIGTNFSYCIGNLNDANYKYHQLILGESARMEGYSTPLEVYNDFYYLTLEGISVGEDRLTIDPKTFRRSWSGQGGVIIDSGTTYTHLSRVGYEELKERVSSLVGSLLERKEDGEKLCYWGNVSRDMKGFPVVTLHLADDADLVLDTDALFQQGHSGLSFCMAVEPVEENDSSIIGIMAQQNYNVGYDRDARKLYLQRIDCQLLED